MITLCVFLILYGLINLIIEKASRQRLSTYTKLSIGLTLALINFFVAYHAGVALPWRQREIHHLPAYSYTTDVWLSFILMSAIFGVSLFAYWMGSLINLIFFRGQAVDAADSTPLALGAVSATSQQAQRRQRLKQILAFLAYAIVGHMLATLIFSVIFKKWPLWLPREQKREPRQHVFLLMLRTLFWGFVVASLFALFSTTHFFIIFTPFVFFSVYPILKLVFSETHELKWIKLYLAVIVIGSIAWTYFEVYMPETAESLSIAATMRDIDTAMAVEDSSIPEAGKHYIDEMHQLKKILDNPASDEEARAKAQARWDEILQAIRIIKRNSKASIAPVASVDAVSSVSAPAPEPPKPPARPRFIPRIRMQSLADLPSSLRFVETLARINQAYYDQLERKVMQGSQQAKLLYARQEALERRRAIWTRPENR